MVLTAALVFFYFRDFTIYFLEWGELRCKKRMAKNEVQKCMEWLFKQQCEMEEGCVGKGHYGVLEALTAQKAKASDIMTFRAKVDKVIGNDKVSEESKKELDTNFNAVSALSKKRQHCLETVTQIAAGEDLIASMSVDFDSRVHHLVNQAEAKRQENGPTTAQSNESMARASQTCVQAVRNNWQWIVQVMQCAEVHVRNAAMYHEFFHEVEEAEYWMTTTLSRIHLSFNCAKLEGNRSDAESIQCEIKDVLAAYLQWQTKVDYLFEKSKEVIPVPQRIVPVKQERPVLALADFSSSEITFIEGESLFLMDNSDRMKWKVRNNAGQVGTVPSVTILIPAPYGEATDAAIRLRIQLLSLWTNSVKRLGYQIIAFMLLVFRDWTDEEVTLLQKLAVCEKKELLRVVEYIDNTLKKNWHEYGDFQELQERIHRLQMIIEESPDESVTSTEFQKVVVIQITTLEMLMKKYWDFWTFWETFKTIVELIKQPEFLLVCDRWEQLRYVTTAHFVKFWDTQLDVGDGDITKQTASLAMCEGSMEESVSSEITLSEEHEDTTTETVSTSLTEEQHTYVIKAVLDPRDGMSALDLQQAIMLGVVDQVNGMYTNPLTGVSMTLKEAMNQGKVMVDFVSKKKIREEKQSYGLLTLKITKENKPYTITGVIDPGTEKELTVAEATHNGVLDMEKATYRTETGENMSLQDAIHSGLVKVEYHEGEEAEPDVEVKTYAVYGVVDQQKKDKVPFNDAINQGLLDKDTGEYFNNVTKERLGVQQAIMRGFLKVRVIKDPSKLDVDPRNMIVVEKRESAKKKLLRGMRAIKMFKQTGKPL